MIVQEHFDVDGRDFIRTYSDANKYVVRDGVEYSEACDPAEFNRQYTEGNDIPSEELDNNMAEIINILTGDDEL